MFENHRKSLIQHCERSELRLHFEWTKVNWKCEKWPILTRFWKPEACGQTVLPDRSVLIGQKLVENAKIEKLKWYILSDFQTMWLLLKQVWKHLHAIKRPLIKFAKNTLANFLNSISKCVSHLQLCLIRSIFFIDFFFLEI